MTILNKIIHKKKEEVALLKENNIVEKEEKIRKKLPTFAELVRKNNKMNIIAEIKRASPSKGMINDGVDPAEQAKRYEASGVQAISVLTDMPFFQGTMDDLRQVRKAVDLPILNKDFIIDSVQIDRAKRAGANIILLIAAALDDATFRHLYEYCREQELEVLCEVHNEEEMERVLQLDATLIGINNRNLKTFEVDLQTTERLAKMVDGSEAILVSESGLATQEDIETVRDAGARAVLVGETFMRAERVDEAIAQFQVPLLA